MASTPLRPHSPAGFHPRATGGVLFLPFRGHRFHGAGGE
ncbi:hypothetical protein UO65_4272 [Actinokineospora spheciospongiae]|uniref:Uncharacterized protein n=1 Tax=Actinokineospora spheciospongiae TaxID=909613 RepID=W7J2V1_9PSEU|nr:hypothetical protein UO65_4272 [Actinokineospora spheciospongiae]